VAAEYFLINERGVACIIFPQDTYTIFTQVNHTMTIRLVLKAGAWIATLLPFLFMVISGFFYVKEYWRWWALFFILGVFAYWSRFIAPWRIKYHDVYIPLGLKKKIVLISDLHIGVFKDETFLRTIVEAISVLDDVDMVLIAGDITYEPYESDLPRLLSPLQDIHFPTYAVLWNHDTGFPWPPIEDALRHVLRSNWVEILENTFIDMEEFILLWLGDKHAWQDDVSIISTLAHHPDHAHKPRLCLVHNPDSSLAYPGYVDLTVAWHTHGAQIRIPWFEKLSYTLFLNLLWPFDRGIHYTKTGIVYVSHGLWEVGFPWRWGSPPTIDILYI